MISYNGSIFVEYAPPQRRFARKSKAERQTPLERLFHKKEFAFGLRYVVQYGKPDKYAKKAAFGFVDSPDKILRHFSEGRLCSLIRTIQTH